MANSIGNIFKVTIWGQSHAPAIGVTIDGLPAGICIDMDKLQAFGQAASRSGQVFDSEKGGGPPGICRRA